MARESKAQLMDRLRTEGRWKAFTERREALKAAGTPAKQAWFEAATEFPPPQPTSTPTRPDLTIDLSPLRSKKPVPVAQAAAWVAENLDADWITPADAPSPGAWSMREWAQSSPSARSDFYKTFVAKIVMPPQEVARREEEESDQQHREFMQRLFGQYEPAKPKVSEEVEQEAHRQSRIRLGEIPG